jgi:soluble lytic murein transglycosylase
MNWVLRAVAVLGLVSVTAAQTSATTPVSKAKKPAAKKNAVTASAKTSAAKKTSASVKGKPTSKLVRKAAILPTPESRRLSSAFIASAQLRPMAQQLVATRSAAAYSGVLAYAASHPGEAAATAELAVGHAYSLDRRYGDAQAAFRTASQKGTVLSDYADYLAAQAAVQGGHAQDAVPLLTGFGDRHPGSLFVPTAPLLLANAYLASNDANSALRVLAPQANTPAGSHADFRLSLAKAYQATGNAGEASRLYRGLYLGDALSPEAAQAKTQLAAMNLPLTAAEKKQHADAMFNAKQYVEAAMEYRALQKSDSGLTQADRDALEIYAAVCDLRLKKLTRADVAKLPVTGDDSAALKLYLQSELARSGGSTGEHDELVQAMLKEYPQSRWLEEALYSGGNMYLLKKDSVHAIEEYTQLVQHFPRSTYAPNAHWHAAWLNYRLRRYPEAARLMDEQIVNYPAGTEIPGALYWRGRLYEDEEQNFSQALNYYKALNAAYVNSYYAMLGRQRMAVIGPRDPAQPAAALASVRAVDDPHLTDALPENDPHLIKARLLANAALNEYIRPEISLSATSGSWGVLAEAEIYQSFGEDTRALQAMKRSRLPFFSLPVAEVPSAYWQMVFPRPYWSQLVSDSQAHGLDPFLVASLIRQESEFNPGAVSKANAYGLMQLLPSTGKAIAKKQGEKKFSTNELLDPIRNLSLGTQDLRNSLDRYSGQVEYALAAYNAGDGPVHQWIAMNDYKDIPEWVESIPYTETREYVQGIIRNREMYRAVYGAK